MAPTSTASSPWLTGAWAPVTDELDTGDLPVTGELPAGLRGAYLRNGPNPAFAPLGAYHLFDGDGMVHAIELDGGRARYRNRWIESAGLGAERRAGRALFGGLAEFSPPDPEVVAEVGGLKNTANTHLVRHGGRTLALLEAGKPTELGPDLATIGEFDYDGALQGPMTAHPKVDPETGELVFFGYSPFPPYVRLHVADAAGRLVTSVPIDLPGPVMMHDFAVSRDRVVLFDLPAAFDLQALLAGKPGIRWAPERGALIGVLDRARPTDPVRWIEVEPFWMFHVLNAHDDGDAVVVEGCRTDRLNIGFGDETATAPSPTLHRWRIDPVAGTVRDEPLDDRAGDFPRINDDRAGRDARYGYVAHARGRTGPGDASFDSIVKYDLADGTAAVHAYGDGAAAGEAAFAPDPDRSTEDGGWLLGFVHDRITDTSSLRVVDAESLDEVARVHLPRRVPLGFHGAWLAQEA